MTVHIAADHRGFELKEALKLYIESSLGHRVVDHGNETYDAHDDYPDTAVLASRAVRADAQARGVVLCGSGVGVNIVANKVAGVRSVLGFNPEQVGHARASDNCTMLALPADFITQEDAETMVRTFLETAFEHDEADVRRLEKVAKIEVEK